MDELEDILICSVDQILDGSVLISFRTFAFIVEINSGVGWLSVNTSFEFTVFLFNLNI